MRTVRSLLVLTSCAVLIAAPASGAGRPAHAPVEARLESFCNEAGQTIVQVTVFNPSTKGTAKLYSIGWTFKPAQDGQQGWSSHLAARETYLFEQSIPDGSAIHVKVATDNYVQFSKHPLVNRTIKDHCG